MNKNESENNNPKSERTWYDLWACWLAVFPYFQDDEAPDACFWKQPDSLSGLEAEYKKREGPHQKEIIECIEAIFCGEGASPSKEAEYFLGERWNVILDFLHSLGAFCNGVNISIIPPSDLPETSIAKWLLTTWWDSHGVRRIAEMEIIDRIRRLEPEN